ncbi:unnamed protein product [Heterobilharzia americana]|nr:unnamed protein product [Heterobilharzia americana]
MDDNLLNCSGDVPELCCIKKIEFEKSCANSSTDGEDDSEDDVYVECEKKSQAIQPLFGLDDEENILILPAENVGEKVIVISVQTVDTQLP